MHASSYQLKLRMYKPWETVRHKRWLSSGREIGEFLAVIPIKDPAGLPHEKFMDSRLKVEPL